MVICAPIAINLIDSGYALTVYNRTPNKTESLRKRGAAVATEQIDVVEPGGMVISVLWDADADVVESIVTAAGFLERLGVGGIHVSMCTCLPTAAWRILSLHARHGATYIEAPVFGRHEAAVAKKLWMPFAGPQSAKDRVRPLLMTMGVQGVFDFGEEIGAATMVKIVGNFLLMSATASLTEALRLIDVTAASLRRGPIWL